MVDYVKDEDETATAKPAKPAKNKGGRPRNDPTKTPEFQAAVAAAAAAMEADIVARITANLAALRSADAAPAAASTDSNMIAELTKSIMAMVNVNKPEQPLSPEEVQRRADGRARLIELLVPVQTTDYDAPDAPEAPFYRVVAKTFLTDFVVEPFEVNAATKAMEPKTIHWTGTPNECLEPINDSAKAIFSAYLQSIGGSSEFNPDSSISNVELDRRPYGVTPGGIVVKGLNISSRRTVGGIAPGSTTDVMGIRGQTDPRAKRVNVLGTVAAPAESSNSDAPTKFAGRLSA
ncbi:MAG: hypothetical protein E6R03_13910 [Hyphomicrobiaceae bacterium]|nr:MAG: hypothetical protein E6R03_13910 [Hyphomicrobiaceae bacterium]